MILRAKNSDVVCDNFLLRVAGVIGGPLDVCAARSAGHMARAKPNGPRRWLQHWRAAVALTRGDRSTQSEGDESAVQASHGYAVYVMTVFAGGRTM